MAASFTLPIQEKSYPNLVVQDAAVVHWTSGFALEMFLSCALIRFSRFGIRCVLHKKNPSLQNINVESTSCLVASTALCNQTSTSKGFNHFFPEDVVRVKSSDTEDCAMGHYRVMDDFFSDLSLCDLEANTDVIYDPVHQVIYWKKHTSGTTFLQVVASILIVVQSILACESLIQQDTTLRDNTSICVIALGCGLLMLFDVDGRKFIFLTWEDNTFYLISVFYIVAGIFAWMLILFKNNADLFPASQRYGINSSIATIHLLCNLLLEGPDNEYSAAFFVIFLFRFLCKTREWERKRTGQIVHELPAEWSLFANLVMVADLFYCSVCFQLCLLNQFFSETGAYFYAVSLYSLTETIAHFYLKT